MHYTKITSTITMLYGQLSPATVYKLQAVVYITVYQMFYSSFHMRYYVLVGQWVLPVYEQQHVLMSSMFRYKRQLWGHDFRKYLVRYNKRVIQNIWHYGSELHFYGKLVYI